MANQNPHKQGFLKVEKRETRIPLSPFFIETLSETKAEGILKPQTIHKPVTHKKKRASRLDKYTIPIIVPSNYAEQPLDEQTKDWYIFFRYRMKPGEPMTPILKRVDLNYYKGTAKIKRAEFLRSAFEKELKAGADPFEDVIRENENPYSYLKTLDLPEALDQILEIKKGRWAKKTVSTYSSAKTIFCKFLTSKGYHKRKLHQFSPSMAMLYSDWLTGKGYSGTSHNNQKNFASIFFGYFIERDLLDVNPFSKVKDIPTGDGGHLPFSDAEIKKIKEYCRHNYPSALTFTLFAEDTLLRTGELRRVTVGDIDFKNLQVKIVNNARAGKQTKDKSTRYVSISKDVAEKLKVHCAGADLKQFVFAKKFQPGGSHGSRTDISKDYTEILRKLGFGSEYTLYSLRHTGAQKKWRKGISAYELMNTLGHENFETTRKYLRGLGIYDFK